MEFSVQAESKVEYRFGNGPRPSMEITDDHKTGKPIIWFYNVDGATLLSETDSRLALLALLHHHCPPYEETRFEGIEATLLRHWEALDNAAVEAKVDAMPPW